MVTAATGDDERRRALVIDNRPLPTNYLLGYARDVQPRIPDYAALRVATAVLSGRLFTEVRSRRNLSYAVEAPFMERANAVGGLYVTTVSTRTKYFGSCGRS